MSLCFRSLVRPVLSALFNPRGQTMDHNATKNVNVGLVGLAFMLVFTAFNTLGNVQTTILKSAADPASPGYVPGFHGSGYVSLAIIYTVFSAANWLSPSVVALLGPRPTMVAGGLFYALFIAQFIVPMTWLLYLTSALLGFGAAIIWNAQGTFLTINSDTATNSRNSGIFWAMVMASNVIGNTFVFLQFRGLSDIDSGTRTLVASVLLGVCFAGIVVLCLLRPTPWDSEGRTTPPDTPAQALSKAWRLLWTRDMLLLFLTFFYTGLELTFWSGVYGPCIGFTESFGTEAKSLTGLHGIFLGAGEVTAGLMFGIFGNKVIKQGRDPVVMLGFIVHLATFFLIFINVPDSAPFGNTPDPAYITPSPYLAILCSFLLGFGDSCFVTQIFSLIGSFYKDNSTAAYALYRFVQSCAAALAFFYSDIVSLYPQLVILTVWCLLGTYGFVAVEKRAQRTERNQALLAEPEVDPEAILDRGDPPDDNEEE